MSRYIMTIDPGITGTGYAIWDGGEPWNYLSLPLETGALLPGSVKGADNHKDKAARVMEKFDKVVAQWKPVKIYCEEPKLMESNFAATRGGNTFKLAQFVGRIQALCSFLKIEYVSVDVNEWKGQTKKPAVDAKILRMIGQAYPEHASDAVGIGLWAKGCWYEGKGTTITRITPVTAPKRVVRVRRSSKKSSN